MKNSDLRAIRKIYQNEKFRSGALIETTILLPTFNRAKDLQRTLLALEKQCINDESIEIIVVDDGSNDNTLVILNQFALVANCRLAYIILKKNGGPARARNWGLALSRGRIVLIIGDDIEPAPLLLEKHIRFHRRFPDKKYALLGHVAFPADLNPSPFMSWLESSGRKYFFNFADLRPNQIVGPLFFYTCNVSVKASLLEKSGWFDTSFPFASHEDLELGFRLAEKGMQLIYDPSALGFHWHKLSVQGIARRVYLMGYSAQLFWRRVKEKGSLVRRMARSLLAWGSTRPWCVLLWQSLFKKQYNKRKQYPIHWHALLFFSFFIGLSDSINKQSPRL